MADDLLQDALSLPSDDHGKERHVYLEHLAEQTTASLDGPEAHLLAQSSHSLLMAIQSLSKRSHKAIITSIEGHVCVRRSLPAIRASSSRLKMAIPKLDNEALKFSTTYNKASGHGLLVRRRRDLVLLRNVERLTDVLELPTLMSTTISSGQVNHSLALDLNGHIRRLAAVYPESPLVASVTSQADLAIHQMAADLVQSLDASALKLASAMRSMSLLRRILPDLASIEARDLQEKALGVLFLLRRLSTLTTTLEALEPLRRLADGEKSQQAAAKGASLWSGGQHTERYLKRYIEIFREHSFGIVSMFKSIFASHATSTDSSRDPLQPLPSGLSTFPLHLTDLLLDTLKQYLPVVKDQSSRDSILTQVLYCAGSLGRLSGEFGILLAGVGLRPDSSSEEDEWIDIVKRHRLLTGRLESVLGEFKGSTSRKIA